MDIFSKILLNSKFVDIFEKSKIFDKTLTKI